MTKLTASMKDAAWNRARSMRHCYRVGTYRKGCNFCGDYYWEEVRGRDMKHFTSGMNVFRSYHPAGTGWTYLCWDCSAKDAQAWENPSDLGLDAIRGTREAVAKARYHLRKEQLKLEPAKVRVPSRTTEIAALEEEVKVLMALLKGRS